MSMSPAELETFLAQTFPTPLGVIATLRRDGSPHIVPVWFRWDTGVVKLWITETRVWVRNLLRDPRVAFVIRPSRRGGTARYKLWPWPSIDRNFIAILRLSKPTSSDCSAWWLRTCPRRPMLS